MKPEDVLILIRQELQKGYAYHKHTGVDGSQLLSFSSAGAGLNGFQTFTSTGTFTAPKGFTKFFVRLVGAGGGTTSPNDTAGAGAGAGAYAEKLCTISGSVSVTIGAAGTGGVGNNPGTDGGDTIFGSFFTAGGGKKGGTLTSNGLGGTATGGDLNVPGGSGNIGYQATTTLEAISGYGGGSFFGTGGTSVVAQGTALANAVSAIVYGAGAGGAASGSTAVGFPNGGNGSQGLCLVSW